MIQTKALLIFRPFFVLLFVYNKKVENCLVEKSAQNKGDAFHYFVITILL